MSLNKRRRVLLKLSGEILSGNQTQGVDPKIAQQLAKEVAALKSLNIDIGIVLGAGNIFRGRDASEKGMDRVTADYIGMVGTIINSVTLQDSLEQLGCETRTLSGIDIPKIAEPYIRRRAIRHLDKERIVIIAGGTGNPFFSTDSAAALRAVELNCDLLIKGTKVDGVFDTDPNVNSEAKKFKSISFSEVLEKELAIMDLTAITLCKENKMPIRVLDITKENNLFNFLNGINDIGTSVK
jgi:uridylate kinase|tara:strand:+ start:269 stop:985 length:717 start_codon:yes stop_codon:yes gene_type:complete